MAGRHSKLTPELQERLIAYIRGGAWDYIAAQAAGISRTTFYRWYNAGANPRSRYAKFREAVDVARAEARVVAETTVFRAKPEAWPTRRCSCTRTKRASSPAFRCASTAGCRSRTDACRGGGSRG